MVSLQDHIEELRAELNACCFTAAERSAVRIELTAAIARRDALESSWTAGGGE